MRYTPFSKSTMKNINYISKRTLHLLSLEQTSTKFSPRSACIIEYKSSFYLCTVSHNLSENNFFLNILSDSQTNQEIHTRQLESPNLAVKTDISKFTDVDDFMNLMMNFNR